MKDIDPYGEEIWEDVDINEKWTIIRHQFPGFTDKSKKIFNKNEADRLCEKWNRECDAYEFYTVEKIKD